jgi:hypothetical protein
MKEKKLHVVVALAGNNNKLKKTLTIVFMDAPNN